MRYAFAVLFIIMVLALLACVSVARRSYKKIGGTVAMLIGMLIPPVIGNLIIILSTAKIPATIGCYIYFLGMDMVMYAVLQSAPEGKLQKSYFRKSTPQEAKVAASVYS